VLAGSDLAALLRACEGQDFEARRDMIIIRITPHFFRRTFAHDWLEGGGSEPDGIVVAGWKTRAMIETYAGDLAIERVRSVHAQLSPGDRL
jgi:integrase